jgi:hypothetical protein
MRLLIPEGELTEQAALHGIELVMVQFIYSLSNKGPVNSFNR